MSERKTIRDQVIEAIKKQSDGKEITVSIESTIKKTKNLGWNQVRDALYVICRDMTPIKMNDDGIWCLDNADGRGRYKLVFLGPSGVPKLQNQSTPVQQEINFEKPENKQAEEIQEMLQWWRDKKDNQIHLGEVRPILDGSEGQKFTRVKVDVRILKMATEKVKKERAQTGGSVSKLVELLLWKYLGEPEEFIVR